MNRLIATMIVVVSVLMAAVCQADSCEDNNRSRQQEYADCMRQCSNAREDCAARARVELELSGMHVGIPVKVRNHVVANLTSTSAWT